MNRLKIQISVNGTVSDFAGSPTQTASGCLVTSTSNCSTRPTRRWTKMDGLGEWEPTISWGNFKQGAVSDDMWRSFKQVVRLCHASCHWEQEKRKLRTAPKKWSHESTRNFNQRREGWRDEFRRCEGHMNRAQSLAVSTMVEMRSHIDGDNLMSPDSRLCLALIKAVRGQPQMRCKVAAFNAFDADTELAGGWEQIADRWLIAAGYSATM